MKCCSSQGNRPLSEHLHGVASQDLSRTVSGSAKEIRTYWYGRSSGSIARKSWGSTWIYSLNVWTLARVLCRLKLHLYLYNRRSALSMAHYLLEISSLNTDNVMTRERLHWISRLPGHWHRCHHQKNLKFLRRQYYYSIWHQSRCHQLRVTQKEEHKCRTHPDLPML